MKQVFKWTALTVGTLVGIAHIGILGHLIKPNQSQVPQFNIPDGPYSSYRIEAGKDGYTIIYRADDPLVLESERSMTSDEERRGLFGGGTTSRTEYRVDQFTQTGSRNLGGEITEEGKSVRDIECIVADAGSRSQGAMAGNAIATGLLAPAVVNIPYVGWLAAGWTTLLGNQVGEAIGSEVGSVFNDC